MRGDSGGPRAAIRLWTGSALPCATELFSGPPEPAVGKSVDLYKGRRSAQARLASAAQHLDGGNERREALHGAQYFRLEFRTRPFSVGRGGNSARCPAVSFVADLFGPYRVWHFSSIPPPSAK